MGVESFIRIGVSCSMEDWILDDIEGICTYLKLKQIPKSLKGPNGNARLCDLYSKAKKIYSKGYSARDMISRVQAKQLGNFTFFVLSSNFFSFLCLGK